MARNLGTLEYLVDIDTSGVYAGAAEVEAVLKSIPDEKVNLEIDTNVESLRKARSELVKYQKLLKSAMDGKKLDMRTKAFRRLPEDLREFITESKGADVALKRITSALDRNAAGLSAWTYKQREASNATRTAAKALRDKTKNDADAARLAAEHEVQITKLAEKYSKLSAEIDRRQRNPFARDTERERRELERLNAELELTRTKYLQLGGTLDQVSGKFDRDTDRLSNMIKTLSNVRIHFGFFSASIKQAALALAILGPILSATLGGVVALGGAIGQALVGALGLATAAAGGLGLSLLGIGIATKPLFDELSTAAKAATKYQEQVLKTGKNSEEAQEKLEEYRQTVKNLPKDTQDLIAKTGVFVTEWQKLTDSIRPEFFETAGVGIDALSNLMPMFAKETKSAFSVVSSELQRMAKGLGGVESRNILQTMMAGSTRALPGFMRGIGSIVAALGRLGAASSKHLPSVADNFAAFGQRMSDLTASSSFQATADRMIGQLRSIGALASSATKYFVTLMNAGSGAGQDLVQSMTAAFNRWTAWMKTTSGQNALEDFFRDSALELSLLVRALTPFLKILGRWTEATRPLSQVFLRLTAAVGNVLEPLSRLGILMDALAVAFTVKVFKTFFSVLRTAPIIFSALKTVLAGATAAMVANTAATNANTAAQVANGTAARGSAAANLGFFGSMAAGTKTTGRLGGALLGVGRAFGPWGMAITTGLSILAIYHQEILGLFKDTTNFEAQLKAVTRAQENANDTGDQAANATNNYREEVDALTDSVRTYNKAIDRGASLDAQQQNYQAVEQSVRRANAAMLDAQTRLQAYQDANAKLRETAREAASAGAGMLKDAVYDQLGPDASRRVSDLIAELGSTPAALREIQKEFPSLKIPGETIRGFQKLANVNLSRVARDINTLRIGMGKGVIPSQVGDEIGRVMDALGTLPKGAKQAQSQFITTLTQLNAKTAGQLALLMQRLTSTPGGKKMLPGLLEGFKRQNPTQMIKSVQGALRNLGASANLPRIKIRGIDQIQQLRQQLENLKKAARGGATFTIKNLRDTSSKLDNLYENFEEFKPKNVALEINPKAVPRSVQVTVNEVPGTRVGNAMGGSALYMNRDTAGTPTRGGRYSKPSFLVGEENRPEYVIATNPSYRQNNIKYWMEAGTALGIPGFKGGGKTLGELETSYRTKQAIVTRFTDLAALYRRQETLRQEQGLPFRSGRIEGALRKVWKTTTLIQKLFDPIISRYNKKIKAVGESDLKKSKKKEKIQELESKQREYKQASKNYDITVKNAKADLDEFKNEMNTGAGFGVNPFLTEMLTYTQSQYQLGQQFGSNMLRGAAEISGVNVTAAGGSPALSPRSAGAGGAGGRSINITNNYQEPPADPHTWSKQLAWEVGVG